MNKLYIAHMKSNGLASRFIVFMSSFNEHYSVEKTSAGHTALIYENEKKERFLIEADLIKGVYVENFEKYMENSKEIELVVHYTPLEMKIENFQEFSDFLNNRYVNSLYSVKKALKSFRFEENQINEEDLLKLFNKINKNNSSNTNGIFQKIIKFLSTPFVKLFQFLSSTLRNLTTKYSNKLIDDVSKKISSMNSLLNADEIKLLQNLTRLESMNTDPNKKFFYCTELVITIIRDWCTLKNVDLPDFLQEENIVKKQAYEIYPQELFDIIKEKNSNYILKTID